MKRIVLVVNKAWEVDPLVGVLVADGNRIGETVFARPTDPTDSKKPLGTVKVERHPVLTQTFGADAPAARVRWQLDDAEVEVWCVQDLMGAVAAEDLSSSERKVGPVRAIVGSGAALVIAVGTAGHPEAALAAGSVLVGRKIFVHDAHPNGRNRRSGWRPPRVHEVFSPASVTDAALRAAHQAVVGRAEQRFVRAPLRPADQPIFVASDRYVSVGTVNVTDYREYAWADLESLERFREKQREQRLVEQIGSIETTHAIVAFEAERANAPFLWCSGIANAAGHFGAQVGQRTHAQNFVAAHNAGAALAWLVPELVRAL
jgi:hypothetical protein